MFISLLYNLAKIIIRLIIRINGGLEVKSKENVPLTGGVIIAANHISYLDPPIVGAVLPRRATFMARKGLFEMPILGWAIKQCAIPVDRQKTRPSTIKEAIRRLKAGEAVVLFPEGRRSETGELLEGKRGIGMLVSMSNVPVVPAFIIGSDQALPVDAKWLKRAKVTVVFGKPIYYTSIHKEAIPADLLHDDISKTIMNAIREMKNNYASNSR
ncbi:MAG: 1-acyl-sn-glycerol-3-phosphate acyltransferase [Nitrospiraceae bacterium]|nr:MAG: 1-acyl-sn-glycerol-3-phosphate acyltransferase [Nitrospiraceae bacterium]